MNPSRRAGRLLALAALVLACAGPAIARDDDPEFVSALADRGYPDLADKEIDQMLAGSPTPDKRENGEYARCMLLRRVAIMAAGKAEPDPKDVREKFAAAGKAFDAFIKKYPASRLRAEAEFNMANLMKDFAYYLVSNLEKFDAKEQGTVKQEATKTFDDAIRYLQSIRDREEEKDKPKEDTDDTKYVERNKAWYYLCVAMHDRAMLQPVGDAMRIQQLSQAIDETTKFLEATDGYIFGYYAGWRLGLSYWERARNGKSWSAEDIKQAREWFSAPVDGCDVPNVEQEWPGLVDVCLQAAKDYGRMCNEVGTIGEGAERTVYPDVFVKKVEHMEEKLPSLKTEQFGLQVLIEKARAMQTLGMAEDAVTLLNQISNAAQTAAPAWGPAVDQLAKRALNEVLSGIPSDSPLQIGPDVLYKAAEGSLRDGNYGRAIRAYQRVLNACEAEADADRRATLKRDYWHRCWLKINFCYASMGRHMEAFYAADYPVQRYLAEKHPAEDEDDDIDNLVRYRVTAIEAQIRTLSANEPKEVKDGLVERAKKARELMTDKFPLAAGSVAYQVAVGKLSAANSFAAAGDPGRAADSYKEAIDLFGKVEAKDAMYDLSQARIGECYVQGKKFDEGLKHLAAFVAKNLARWKDPATPAALKQPWGWAVRWIAIAHDAQGQPAKVVEDLADFEKSFEGASLASLIPSVRSLRTSALIRSGKGEEGVREADRMRKENPESPDTSTASLAAANDLRSRADKLHATGDEKGSQAMKKRAVDFYDFWLKRASNVGAEQYVLVGYLHNDVEDFDGAATYWQKALDIYEKAGKKDKAEQVIVNLSSLLVGQGRYAEALPKFEALFYKAPEDAQPIRECLEAVRRVPSNVPKDKHMEKVKDIFNRIALELAKDPAGVAQAGEAKRAAAEGNVEIVVRAYTEPADARRALSRAVAYTVLGYDAAMSPDVKNTVFLLVKRSPDMMSNLARCYEELAKAETSNAIRAVNLYRTLIEAAPEGDLDNPAPGCKYTEKWFAWKLHWAKVALVTGQEFKNEEWLRMVCQIVASMETLNEMERADKDRVDFSKEFRALRDQADNALRGLGKDGCK